MFSKPKNYLGVDIGSGGIKVVELSVSKHRPVLYTYALAPDDLVINGKAHSVINADPLDFMERETIVKDKRDPEVKPEDVDANKIATYANILKAIKTQAKITAKSATVSLPVSSVFHAVVTLPIVEKAQFDKILQAEIKKLVPFPLEKLSIDYQILNKDLKSKEQRVLVNAVERARVEFLVKVFTAAGLTLDALEPESTALTRVLMGKDTSTSMIVDMGANRTNFFMVDGGVPVTHHSIEVGGNKIDKILSNRLGVSAESMGQIKKDLFASMMADNNLLPKDSLFNMIAPVIDPIVKEIDYSFELFLRQPGNEDKKPEKIILTGGSSIIPFLPEYLEQKFNKKCFLGDPWARIVYQDKLRPLLSKLGPRMSVAVGLALRSVV